MRNSKTRILSVVLLILFVTFSKGLNYVVWDDVVPKEFFYFLYLSIMIYTIANFDKSKFKYPLWSFIVCLLLAPLLLAVIRQILGGSGILDNKQFILSTTCFLLYYIFFINKVHVEEISNTIIILSLMIFVIQIFQQFFPSKAVFGVYGIDKQSELGYQIAPIRNGLWRFSVPVVFALYSFYFYWAKIQKKMTVSNVLMFAIFAVSIYLRMNRLTIVACVITLALSVFMRNKDRSLLRIIVISLAIALLLATYSSQLFGEMVRDTQSDLDSDYIRVVAYNFFGEKIFASLGTFLFGYGYLEQVEAWKEIGLFTSDIGFVGECFTYGILWIVLYVTLVYTLLVKYKAQIPLYIRLFVISTTISSIMVFPYRNGAEYILWASILYISSKSVIKHRLKHEILNHNSSIQKKVSIRSNR